MKKIYSQNKCDIKIFSCKLLFYSRDIQYWNNEISTFKRVGLTYFIELWLFSEKETVVEERKFWNFTSTYHFLSIISALKKATITGEMVSKTIFYIVSVGISKFIITFGFRQKSSQFRALTTWIAEHFLKCWRKKIMWWTESGGPYPYTKSWPARCPPRYYWVKVSCGAKVMVRE